MAYTKDLKSLDLIEKSIQKTYRKEIWAKFIKAIKNYELIKANDKIAVAVSGGKDSLLLAKLFMQLQKISDIPFEVIYIVMDPGFNQDNLKCLKENCKHLNIPIKIKNSDIFKVAEKIAGDNPCYMCARMRRGFLYNFAQEQGCNKLALGHHFDDVIETTLLNIFYGAQFKTMVPKVKSENFKNMELIRPLVLIKEKDIIRFIKNAGINTMDCGCTITAKAYGNKRQLIKEIITKIKKDNPYADQAIFKAATNINLNQVYGYEFNKIRTDFNKIFSQTSKKEEE